MDTLDNGIDSHKSIEAIFSMNEMLMRQLPHEHLQSMVENIISNGKSHKYLSLFRCIASVGDKNILENQMEIIKCLSTTGRLQKIGCYLVPINHPEYEPKIKNPKTEKAARQPAVAINQSGTRLFVSAINLKIYNL
jgi:hypothetical protein